ncbi:squalene/phytoene synthase family protein [Flexivirga alba]|uniref:Squalene/phytoene synthase family protein n=1 Tax=Flexivirga alba TaxID=702742 RepID=A0ABW2ACU4_9MICO
MIGATTPSGVSAPDVTPSAATENFPVALRILPARYRHALLAVYDVARHIDQLGDAAQGDRVAALQAFRADLSTFQAGLRPSDRVLVDLAPYASEFGLPLDAFDDLIEANLLDQHVTRYPNFAALLDYCALSAHPIGRLVLAVFGQSTAQRIAWSDTVCAALQILEHCQDVVEDHRAGRVYLPQDQLYAAGLTDTTMLQPGGTAGLRSVVLAQVATCREMLSAGTKLVGELHGWGRVAVAGYVAGGLATADALDGAGGDVTDPENVRPRRVTVLRHGIRLLITSGRR